MSRPDLNGPVAALNPGGTRRLGPPAVMVRKNSYANGGDDGAETQSVLMNVFRTLKQRGHNPVSPVLDAVRAFLRSKRFPLWPAKVAETG